MPCEGVSNVERPSQKEIASLNRDALEQATQAQVAWADRVFGPHLIVSTEGKFKSSPLLDTNARFSAALMAPGTYKYFCSLHPQMQGTIVVE